MRGQHVPPIPRSEFRGLLKGLSADEFAAFVADLWEARGWTASIRGDAVVATRDAPTADRNVLLVRHAAPLLDRVDWETDRSDVTHVVTSGAGSSEAEEFAAALDADLVDRTDLYDVAMFAVDPDRREELFRRHFDRSATVDDPGGRLASLAAVLRTRRGKLAALAIVCVAFVVASGAVPLSGDSPGPAEDSDARRTPIVTASPEPFTVDASTPAVPTDTPTPAQTPTPTETPWMATFDEEDIAVTPGSGGDRWDAFRGNPARTGYRAGLDGPRSDVGVLARLETDFAFVSSPAVVNGTVYLGNVDGNFYALDAATLRVTWDRYLNGAILSSPAVADGTVYVGSLARTNPRRNAAHRLRALDAERGENTWNASTGPISLSSPVAVDGTVYVGARDGGVYAIDEGNGSIAWRTGTNDTVDSSPAVVDGTVYVGSTDGRIYALDATNGSVEWRTDTNGTVYSTTAVWNETVYVGSSHGNVYSDDSSGSVYALHAANGSVRWRLETGESVVSSPAVVDGTVYVGDRNGVLYALDAANGSVVWSGELSDGIVASPVVANETVYVAARDGLVSAFDARTGDERWSYHTRSPLQSSPAVANGVLYVATEEGRVVAIAERSGD